MTFCQSCGMPLSEEVLGTNDDGSKNEEYCVHCFSGGTFTSDVKMEEMIDICVPFMVQANPQLTEETCKAQLDQFMPTLKRWK